jgi:hypothetical protein
LRISSELFSAFFDPGREKPRSFETAAPLPPKPSLDFPQDHLVPFDADG